MGPKKKDVASEINVQTTWRTVIEDKPLDDENWTVKVVMIEAAGGEQDRIYLNKFETFAVKEKRFVIKNICKTETIFMINQLGAEKKVKDDSLRVFEEAQAYLKNKEDVAPDIMALVIKHLILKMKDEYQFIKKQRLEVKTGLQRESATMLDKGEVRGAPKHAAPSEAGAGKEATDAPQDDIEGKKFNTSLRERGEEWRDKVYVDDFPDDGPDVYVAVTGFVDPYLPSCMIRIGIPLTAIVQIRINPLEVSIPSGLVRPTKRGQSLTEMLAELSLRFWEDLQVLRIHRDTVNDFKNTAFIVFAPPYWTTETLSGDPEKIYDELSYLMYDVQDLSRQHLHYIDNMNIVKIPQDGILDLYLKYYNQQMDDIPSECTTIYSVVDSILQTACKSTELEEIFSRSSLFTAVTVNNPGTVNAAPKRPVEDVKEETTENVIKNIFTQLCNTEATKNTYRVSYGEFENQKDPIIINYGDIAKYKTFHLGNLNLDRIVVSSLLGMPINNLWRNRHRPTGEIEAKLNFHVNVLLSCFEREDVETAELNRLIHILACRKLYNNRSSLKKRHLPPTTITDFKKNYLKRSILAEPLAKCPSVIGSGQIMSPSFPSITKSENESDIKNESEITEKAESSDPEVQRIKFLFDCPDISDLVTHSEIDNFQPVNHIIDDYSFFEDLTQSRAFQMLREAFNKYNCVDYKFCDVTDCLLLMFFNSHDKDGIARDEWRCHLTTPLCLQDFFDYILEEQYDWICNEEKEYDEQLMIKSKSLSKDAVDPNALQSCLETTDVEVDLLMENSLKYNEYYNQPEEATQSDSETVDGDSKKNGVSRSTEALSKTSKKSKTASPKTTRQSFTGVDEGHQSIEIPAKPFLGYDLGDRRVEVFGKAATFFSKDGTKVSSDYILTIPMNSEYIALNVVPGNSYNEFWVHRALGDFVDPDFVKACDSFRIKTKNDVMIYLKKQNCQGPTASSSFAFQDDPTPADISQKPVPSHFHSLFITYPNGMITETVYDTNSPVMSHIKQYYTCPVPNLDEEMRCISFNGEVMIFTPSGDIEVLKPDGTYIKITKYNKQEVVPPEPPPPPEEAPSDKSKKTKSKTKMGKSATKAAKPVLSQVEEVKPSAEHITEYEIIVDEFEIIEPTGLRQQWINNKYIDIEKMLVRTATDYYLGEIFSRRLDGTNILLNKDGISVVTFPNKTRIITSCVVEDEEIYPEWTEEEMEYFEMFLDKPDGIKSKSELPSYGASNSSSTISKKIEEEEFKERERADGFISIKLLYTIEHVHFSTVTINTVTEKISVDSPNDTSVFVDKNNNYDIKLDDVTMATFDGKDLNIAYEACCECKSFTTCNIKIVPTDFPDSVDENSENYWLKMKDSFNKTVVVTYEGNINILEESISESGIQAEEIGSHEETSEQPEPAKEKIQEKVTVLSDIKSESSVVSQHGKCRGMYLAKNMRFFVMNRELNCSELLHQALLENYKQDCRWLPWCTINKYDVFGDHRRLVSILTPVHLTETEKWYMNSKLADKPKFLTYKDLKKDSGKGFYHWMRPYERFEPKGLKPESVLPQRLPRAFILRTLEQEWDDPEKEELKGARELVKAVLRYRCIMEADSETILNIPIIDLRTDSERRIDDMVQALGHKIYENLKMRIAEDFQSRGKITITTSPPPKPSDVEHEAEDEMEEEQESRIEEEREAQVKEGEAAEPMSDNLRRYWRRRAEEYKEEQFYKYLLREGNVPPYFRNMLGGAIWWDVNNAATEAAFVAERRKMKCVCAPEECTPDTETIVNLPFM